MTIPTLLGLLVEAHELADLAPQLAGYETSSDVVDLLIQIFLQQVDRLIWGGLKRSYLGRDDELTAVRGRIDVRQTMAVQLSGRAKVWCRYEEYSLDGPENRTLLTTHWTIAGCGALAPERRRLAHRLTADFEHVSHVHVAPADPTKIRCDRLTKHYEPVLRLAHVILASMGISHEFGELEADGFLLNMNTLFERFVCRRLRRLLGPNAVRVSDQQVFAFDEETQATIRPDLLLHGRSGRRLVADTKYKLTADPSPADLYQMLAYCRILRIRRGVLITVGTASNRQFVVRDGETVIDIMPVNLGGHLEDVHESVNRLANFIRYDCGLQ